MELPLPRGLSRWRMFPEVFLFGLRPQVFLQTVDPSVGRRVRRLGWRVAGSQAIEANARRWARCRAASSSAFENRGIVDGSES